MLRWFSLAGLALSMVWFASCVTTEQAAPLVSAGAAGRQVYLTCAASCHSPEPIRKYAREKWPGIIMEMSEQAELSALETERLRAYIEAVLGENR